MRIIPLLKIQIHKAWQKENLQAYITTLCFITKQISKPGLKDQQTGKRYLQHIH